MECLLNTVPLVREAVGMRLFGRGQFGMGITGRLWSLKKEEKAGRCRDLIQKKGRRRRRSGGLHNSIRRISKHLSSLTTEVPFLS